MGGFVCKAGWKCQLGSATGGSTGSTEQMQCSVHGKNRSAMSLEDDGSGGFKCKANMQCQMAAGDMPSVSKSKPVARARQMANPLQMMMQMSAMGMSKPHPIMMGAMGSVSGKSGMRGSGGGGGGKPNCKWCQMG